jgi:hypothetical protein
MRHRSDDNIKTDIKYGVSIQLISCRIRFEPVNTIMGLVVP